MKRSDSSLFSERGSSTVNLILLIAVVLAVYLGVLFAPAYFKKQSLESGLDMMLKKIDSRSVLKMDQFQVREGVIRMASSIDILLEDGDVEVDWERSGGELFLGIYFEYPYTVNLFGTEKDFSYLIEKEKLVTVDVAEERGRAQAKEESDRRRKEESEKRKLASKEQCERYNGEWDGRQCVITEYFFVP